MENSNNRYKFRAWVTSKIELCGEEPQMCYSFNHSEVECNDKGELVGKGILMQFTGLHDKNGKEIYEGDIVKNKTGHDSYKERTVFFENGAFRFENQTKPSSGFIYVRDTTEVIGNIYENPELLNK